MLPAYTKTNLNATKTNLSPFTKDVCLRRTVHVLLFFVFFRRTTAGELAFQDKLHTLSAKRKFYVYLKG